MAFNCIGEQTRVMSQSTAQILKRSTVSMQRGGFHLQKIGLLRTSVTMHKKDLPYFPSSALTR
jgi:hypothetical protein